MSWQLAISLILYTIIYFLVSLLKNLDEEKHTPLIFLFAFSSFFILLLGTNFSIELAIDNSASTGVQDMLSTIYRVVLYTFILFIIYFMLYLVYFIFIFAGKSGQAR